MTSYLDDPEGICIQTLMQNYTTLERAREKQKTDMGKLRPASDAPDRRSTHSKKNHVHISHLSRCACPEAMCVWGFSINKRDMAIAENDLNKWTHFAYSGGKGTQTFAVLYVWKCKIGSRKAFEMIFFFARES